MPAPSATYAPVLDPARPDSRPEGVPADEVVYVPLRPARGGGARGAAWLRPLAATRTVVGHFCVPDPVLLRLERRDPLGIGLASDAGVAGVVTMDVPLYAFMTHGQRERAATLHLHRLLRTLDRAPRLGLQALPLVKAIEPDALDHQLDLLQELGLDRAALYARELILEQDALLLRRFVRGSHRRRIRPLLLGAMSRRALRWGPADLASSHHHVLARRGRRLEPDGRLTELDRRGLDVHALTSTNYATARRRLVLAPRPLEWEA